MKKHIIFVLLFFSTIIQAQAQIDSIKLVSITSDSLIFAVYSTESDEILERHVEYEEDINAIKANVLYSMGWYELDCYCPIETIIRIKKDTYSKAIVSLKGRYPTGGTDEEPLYSNGYELWDTKEIDLLNITNIDTQTGFAPLGAEWYYTYSIGQPEDFFNRVVSEKDTVVEGNNCRIVKQYFNNSPVANEKHIIKQEQGKVYYYYQDQFNLLFDFDAKVGDIVEFTFMYSIYEYGVVLVKDTVLSVKYRIQGITTNAQNIRTFTARGVDDISYGDGIYYPSYTYIYTEKIGLQNKFMPTFHNGAYPDAEIHRDLRCYSDPDFSFVSDWWSNTALPCDYNHETRSISAPQNDNNKVYPNPFNDKVSVYASQDGDIEIVDISGKFVYYSELSNGINEISTNYFPKGIYLAKIQQKDNSIQVFKIIKP